MLLNKQRATKIILVGLNILLAVPLVIYAAATIFTRPSTDDFCAAVVVRQYGVFQAVQWWYNTINGRFLAFLTINTAILGGQPLTALITISFLIVWWVSLFGIFRIVLTHFIRSANYPGLQAGLSASLLLLATLDSVPTIWTTLYWYTGMYVYMASLAMFSLYGWLVLQRGLRPEALVLILCSIVTFAVSGYSDIGGLSQMICLIAGSLIGIAYLRKRPADQTLRRLVIRCVAGLVGAVIGFGLVLTAPGNPVRMSIFSKPDLGVTISGTLSGLGAPALVAFYDSPLTTLCAFLIPALMAYFGPFSPSLRQRRTARLAMIGIILSMLVLIAACFAPGFYFLTVGLDAHSWVTPIYIFMCGFLLLGYAAGVAFKPQRLSVTNFAAVGAAICVAIVIVWSLGQSVYVAKTLQRYAVEWDARDVAVRAAVSRGEGTPINTLLANFYDSRTNVSGDVQPLVIPLLANSPYRWEAGDDMNLFSNKCMARYYNVAALIAK